MNSQLWESKYPNHQLSFPFFPLIPIQAKESFTKKKKHLPPSNLVLLEFEHVLSSSTILLERECYKEKEVRATRRSVSGGRKIDIATRTLGYSVNDDKRLPRTITADNGKNQCWKRGVRIPLQGDVAKNKRPWRKRNGEIRGNKWKGGREGRGKTNRMEINTRISLWIP